MIVEAQYFSFIQPISPEVQEVLNVITPIVNQKSWLMMFAEDEAEFEALWEALKSDMEAANAAVVIEDSISRINAARDEFNSYVN